MKGSEVMALKPKQKLLAELMVGNPYLNNVEYADVVGIDPKTLYKWKKTDEFQAYMSELLREQWKDAEKLAQKKMIELALNGDFRANQYILDNLGYKPTTKVEADINTDTIIRIIESEE